MRVEADSVNTSISVSSLPGAGGRRHPKRRPLPDSLPEAWPDTSDLKVRFFKCPHSAVQYILLTSTHLHEHDVYPAGRAGDISSTGHRGLPSEHDGKYFSL